MTGFDPAKPFAEVFQAGRPPLYEQDGRLFDRGGKPLPSELPEVQIEDAAPPADEQEAGELPSFTIVRGNDGEGEALPAKPDEEFPGLDKMHWTHLKVMVEQYGGTWTNKRDALKFLKGLNS